MTLVVRGSGFSSGQHVAGDRLVLHPAVRRAGAVDRDHVHPGGEAALAGPRTPILLEMLISASWQASSASGVYGSTPPADVEAARPDRREQLLHRVSVAALGASRELVDVVRREFLSVMRVL